MTPPAARRLLAGLLYVLGGVMTVAFLAMVMPTAWMEATAGWLEVEPLPRLPLTEYLTRSLSLLYGAFGVLHICLARDVVRYLDLIVVFGWLTMGVGIALTAIDFGAGMPPMWSWTEGPPTVLVGAAYVWLARRSGQPPWR